MAKKNNKFHLRDIILLALVGIIFGVIYWQLPLCTTR